MFIKILLDIIIIISNKNLLKLSMVEVYIVGS